VLRTTGAGCLKELGLDHKAAIGLFRMLDDAGTKKVPIEELECGIMQLKSNPTNLHVSTLMYESKRILMRVNTLSQLVQERFDCLYADLSNPPDDSAT